MTPDRWQQIDQLLDAALELQAHARAAFLAQSCNGDESLRRAVQALLDRSTRADDFFEAPPVAEMNAALHRVESAVAPGQRVGPYRILRELGRGGMGMVLLAVRDDDVYQKQVAIKLVSPNPLQPELLRRFRRERQILADLEHPNIARLLDGGTTAQGWPYVVLEYVEGVPLTQFCHAQQQTLTERLNLFRAVCAAVQYAHQHLVIHRDLKPANILVTSDGAVKLLDFGIAKLLAPERQSAASATLSGMLLMTPEYASPEQMRGEAITTASDVYSLGVLLYELLTGRLPYQLKDRTLPEIIRAVCEDEPLLPSAVTGVIERAALRGDLDSIALTALQKDPARRYRTVQQMSEDLHLHLAGQPILAQTGLFRYRAGKFIRRHKIGVAAAAMMLLLLLAGIVATLWQARKATEQARVNRRLLYAAQINLAGQAWDAANVARAVQLVEASHPQAGEEDLRGFEWYYLQRLCQQNLRATLKHAAEVRAVAISPDGTKVATGDDDGIARLWELTTGRLLATLQAHQLKIHSLAFSPDGKTLATGSEDNLIILWEVASGRLLTKMMGETDAVLKLAFSPDGNWLATASYAPWVDLLKLEDSVLIPVKGHSRAISAIAFSPDSQFIASGSDDSLIKIWQVPVNYLPGITHRCARSWWPLVLEDGVLQAKTKRRDCPNKDVLPVPTRAVAVLQGHQDQIYAVAFAPDGKLLASVGADQTVRLWDAATWRSTGTLNGHNGKLRAVAFAPDGKTLASGGDDRLVKFWDVTSRRETGALRGHGGKIFSLAFAPDGKTLATASDDHTVKLWDVTAGSAPFTDLIGHTDELNSVAFSPDGKTVATASDDKTIKLWDTATGRHLQTLLGHTFRIQAVVYSPDGKRLASASRDGSVIIWDALAGQKLFNLQANHKDAITVAFSPDSRTLATGGMDDAKVSGEPIFGARLWDATNGQLLFSLGGHYTRILGVAFSPDGRLLATSSGDRMIKLWNVASRQEIATLKGHQSEVWTVAFAPDGRTLASGGNDRTIRLWDVATHHELARLEAHSDSIQQVAFSPDGRRLASASYDSTVKLWDVDTKQELITLKGHQEQVCAVAFSPDGQTLASASSDRTARLWREATLPRN